ncbi:VOC family protein [Lentisphaerota bacterium WC36G]|nr:VOC family protein [Lentisphaerae bacterium WC36]
MKISHIAMWAKDIDKLKDFYVKYFAATPNKKYINEQKGFSSYFLTFPDSCCRLEIMHKSSIPESSEYVFPQYIGLIHIAISVGSEHKVEELTARLALDGYTIVEEPRKDGYFESVVLDPENNRLELTI